MGALLVQQIVVGPLEVNCYLAACQETGEAVVIDPGADGEVIVETIRRLGWRPRMILNTHGHIDHWAANARVAGAFGVPVRYHEADRFLLEAEDIFGLAPVLSARPSPVPDRFIAAGDRLALGRLTLEVLHTPGHSPGGCCFLLEGTCFSGDTLFAQGIGRTDLPGGDFEQLLESIRLRLLPLPPSTRLLPGHGPLSTVGREARSNPYLTLGP